MSGGGLSVDAGRLQYLYVGLGLLGGAAVFMLLAMRERIVGGNQWPQRWGRRIALAVPLLAAGAYAIVSSVAVMATWEGGSPTTQETLVLAALSLVGTAVGFEVNRGGTPLRRWGATERSRTIGLLLWGSGGLVAGVGFGLGLAAVSEWTGCNALGEIPVSPDLPTIPK